MEKKQNLISERLLDYGVEIIKVISDLNKTMIGRNIAKQLLRSSTSAGANYEETCGAESKADFIHKLHIVFKELLESLYWLRLIQKSKILKNKNIDNLIIENNQLINMVARSVITAKSKT